MWRGLAGRRRFKKERDKLAAAQLGIDFNSVTTLDATAAAVVEQGAKVAWVGYGDEGLTVEQWLTRVGCHSTLKLFREM